MSLRRGPDEAAWTALGVCAYPAPLGVGGFSHQRGPRGWCGHYGITSSISNRVHDTSLMRLSRTAAYSCVQVSHFSRSFLVSLFLQPREASQLRPAHPTSPLDLLLRRWQRRASHDATLSHGGEQCA